MGIYANFLANTKSMDITAPITAKDRKVREWMNAQVVKGDIAEAAAYAAKNEVHNIAVYSGSVTGGTFTLTVTLRNGETFTTAAIAHNANAATIEGAIDTAATAASITGWINGDISVAGGDLTTTPVTLTFDGNSVKEINHTLTTANGGSLTGGGTMGAITTTTNGQSKRTSWAILAAIGAVTAGMPEQGASLTKADLTVGNRDANALLPSAAVLTTLAEEAGIEDDSAVATTAIKEALRL